MVLVKMLRIVFWSFFGVRKSASHQADMADVPLPLLPFVAVALAACFGGVLFYAAKFAVATLH